VICVLSKSAFFENDSRAELFKITDNAIPILRVTIPEDEFLKLKEEAQTRRPLPGMQRGENKGGNGGLQPQGGNGNSTQPQEGTIKLIPRQEVNDELPTEGEIGEFPQPPQGFPQPGENGEFPQPPQGFPQPGENGEFPQPPQGFPQPGENGEFPPPPQGRQGGFPGGFGGGFRPGGFGFGNDNDFKTKNATMIVEINE